MNLKTVSIVLVFLFCWVLFWIVWESGTKARQQVRAPPSSPPPSPPSPSPPPSPPPSPSPPSRFLYLLQTESCLPDSLRSIEAFGNSTTCHCDVLVLSYKLTCNDTPPAHVEYISASSPTSWSEGRNLLFGVAMKRSKEYLYYIFMDDDIILQTINNATGNPWRLFEDFLRRIVPAVGAVEINKATRTLKARKLQGCSLNRTQEYIPAVHYDAAFNAFHYQAVEYILPYPLDFDKISWWFSQWYVIIKSKVVFPGQVVLRIGLIVNNPKHRAYPKKRPSVHEFQDIVKLVQDDLPRKYQNANLLLEWKEYGKQHEKRSSVTCLSPPPPKMTIKPFAHIY